MNTQFLLGLTVLASVAGLGCALWILHKVKLIHIATYRLTEDLADTQRECKALFQQLQSLQALERKLGLEHPLPPMRGWAGSPDFLLQVAQDVRDRRPQVVLECSSGVSTVVAARCAQLNGSGHVFSLEHEAAYAEKTRKLLARYGLSDWATVIDAPLAQDNTPTPWYDLKKLPPTIASIDMLVIDGPPQSLATQARWPALPQLASRLAKRCVVLLDDASRPDEMELVKRWLTQFPDFSVQYLDCEKGLARLDR